ncbi:MAG TPA: hypothetical protein VGP80_04285 [Gemmatimonadales bacterium]|nr:hypothetical protein [Gemmatimonadales bacterium]
MFIELTDILRCPESHEEQFLVLLPAEMLGRSVRSGHLGCPVCLREYRIENGVALLSTGPSPVSQPSAPNSLVDATAVAAFLGMAGPGGYVGVVGDLPGLDGGLASALPGIHVAAVNPPADLPELPMMSLLRSSSIPIKTRSLRGVVLGSNLGTDPAWVSEAVRVVLPGLRVVGQGTAPEREDLSVLASAGGWWVAVT